MDQWQEIRSKTKQELKEIASDFLTDSRIWIQEHGEKSAIIALVAGVLAVLSWPLIVWLVIISGGAAWALWLTAPEEKGSTVASPPENHELH